MADENFTTLQGIWLAKIWIAAPAFAVLPVAAVAGEGDYLVPLMGCLWIACFVFGQNMRRGAANGTIRHSAGFHISLWSALLCALMFIITAAYLAEGRWRYEPPFWMA